MLAKSLDDVLVLDLSQHLSGPFASRILSDLGARVIKVEPPEGRVLPPWPGGAFPGFLPPNVGKESIAIDIKSEEGGAVVRELAAKADVVLENFRPGVTRRLKIDYETLRRDNPDLIYCSITGFGETGPLATKPAFDATIQAMSGMMSATGEADRPPALSTVNIGDLAASCLAATAIIAALHDRGRSGEGRRIDMSMLEASLYLLPIQTQFALQAGYLMSRHGSSYGPRSVAGAFRSADGQYLQVLCPHFGFQARFRDAVAAVDGFEHVAGDARFADAVAMTENSEAFLELAREAFALRDADHWIAALDAADVPWGPIYDFKQAVSQEQIAARGAVGSLTVAGSNDLIPTLRSPFHVAAGEESPPLRVPEFGGDSRAILGEVLGYSTDRIDQLLGSGGVIAPDMAKREETRS